MTLAFIDRPPTNAEVERIRLILSTYQDGTGQNDGGTKPGWRDFERAVAVAIDGDARESKEVFDVLLSNPEDINSPRYGLSCKMRNLLGDVDRLGRVKFEVSNAAAEFWQYLNNLGFNQQTFLEHPAEVGTALVELIHSWHVGASRLLNVDVDHSFYVILEYNKQGDYQLFMYPLNIIDPAQIQWSAPTKMSKDGNEIQSVRICGMDDEGVIVEWFGTSGGQLKYYPLLADAIWVSERFKLEPLPGDTEHGIISKAKAYFPEKWMAASAQREIQASLTLD